MGTREAGMWDRLREPLRLAGFDPVRVENPACPGTPDVNITTGWIELKQLVDWPKKRKTIVRVPHFTPQQRVWLLRRQLAGARAWVLLRVGENASTEWILLAGQDAAKQLGRCTREMLYGMMLARWTPNLVDHEFASVLRP